MQNSDYLLTIGTRLAIPQIGYDLSELARAAIIDVVDIDRQEATKHQSRTREAIVSDAGVFIDVLIDRLSNLSIARKNAWLAQCNGYQTEFPWVGPEHADQGGYMNSYRFMERLNSFFKPNQIVVALIG